MTKILKGKIISMTDKHVNTFVDVDYYLLVNWCDYVRSGFTEVQQPRGISYL